MVSLDIKKLVVTVFSLIVAGMLQRTLLSAALDQFFAVDTAAWTWETRVVWKLLPTVVIALIIYRWVISLVGSLD